MLYIELTCPSNDLSSCWWYLVSFPRLYCNVQFRLSPDQYLAVAGLRAGAPRMCTVVQCTMSPGWPRIASCHTMASIATACHPGLCTASLSQAVTARPGGRGRSRDLSRVTCHAVTWRHTVTVAGLSRGPASRVVSSNLGVWIVRNLVGSDVITNVTKLATNGYKRCNSIN